MSAISDFAASVAAKFDAVGVSLDGIVADVGALKAKIDELQNSAGTVTPADQALLDDIQAKAAALETRVAALDAETV